MGALPILAACMLAAGLLPAAINARAAAVINGDFEDGLNGWYSAPTYYNDYATGTTAIATRDSAYQPIAGSASAFIVALSWWQLTEEVTCVTDLWNAACPLPITFAVTGVAPPTHNRWLNGLNHPYIPPYDDIGYYFRNGGYIAQDVHVAAGDTLAWKWGRYGELAIGAIGGPDYGLDNAWFIATNGEVSTRISIRSGAPASFTFHEGGLWSIFFGVQQTEDNQVWSGLTLDSVRLNSVPEPNTLALGIAAVISLAVARRRRKR